MSLSTETYASLALEDDLTGLGNRRFLAKDLGRRADAKERFSVALLDLDRFAQLNDDLGNLGGDRVLTLFAERLKAGLKPDEVVARTNGDTFCVVLPKLPAADARARVEELGKALGAAPIPSPKDGSPLALTFSAGIAAFPDDAAGIDELLEGADLALYAARKRGGGSLESVGGVDAKLKSERKLFSSLPCGEFVGREGEIAAAERFVTRIRGGKTGMLLVYGDAGCGKTRFLRQIASRMRGTGVLYLYMSCDPKWRDRAGHGLIYLVDRYFERHPAAQERLRTTLQSSHRLTLRELIPTFSAWKVDDTMTAYMGSGRQTTRMVSRTISMLQALEAALVTMAQEAPIVLLLDGIRALDRATFDIVSVIIRESKAAVGIIGSMPVDPTRLDARQDARLVEMVVDLQKRQQLWGIGIPPLADADVIAMMNAILPGATRPPGFDALILSRARGNPLYVEEALRSLMLKGRIRYESVFWKFDAIRPEEVPADLDAAIRSVHDHLPHAMRAFLTNAAVVGTRFDVKTVQDVAAKREGEVLDAVQKAVDAGVIRKAPDGSPDEYEFSGDHARQAQVQAATPEERARLEQRLDTVKRSRTEAPAPGVAVVPLRQRAGELARKPLTAEKVRAFVTALGTWIQRDRLYPQWSKISVESLGSVLDAATALTTESPLVSLVAVPSGLAANGETISAVRGGEVGRKFAALLAERNVGTLSFEHGIDARELSAFVREMCAPPQPAVATSDPWTRLVEREHLAHLDIGHQRGTARDDGAALGSRRGETPLTSAGLKLLRQALRDMRAAAIRLRLYPPGHKLVDEALEIADTRLTDLLSVAKIVTLDIAGDILSANGVELAPEPDDAEALAFLRAELGVKGFRALTIQEGFKASEARALISTLAIASDDSSCRTLIETILGANRMQSIAFDRTDAAPQKAEAPSLEVAFEEIDEAAPLRRETRPRAGESAQQIVSGIMHAMIDGWPADAADPLTQRLAALYPDPDSETRERSLAVTKHLLARLKGPALDAFISRVRAPLKTRVSAEEDGVLQHLLAEVVKQWLAAAVSLNRTPLAADMARNVVKPVIDSNTFERDYRAVLQAKLREFGDESGAALLGQIVNGPLAMRDAAVVVAGTVGPPLIEPLVGLIVETDALDARQAAARALAAIGGMAQQELVQRLEGDVDDETHVRILEVLDVSGAASLEGSVLAALEHASPSVRDAACALLGRMGLGGAPIMRRLITGADREAVVRGLKAAASAKAAAVASEVVALLGTTEDEEIARAGCDFLQAAPSPVALSALRRVFEMRTKMLGLKKGWSDDTRASAIAAAAKIPSAPGARELLDAAKGDPSQRVRGAAGA